MPSTKKKTAKRDPLVVYGDKLNIKQELFCKYYTGQQYFMNATRCYGAAYGYDLDDEPVEPPYPNKGIMSDAEYAAAMEEYKPAMRKYEEDKQKFDKHYRICGRNGNRLLKNAKIQSRIQELILEYDNDEFFDAELVKIARQDHDLTNKRNAIADRNKLRGRLIDKVQVEREFDNLTDEELDELLKKEQAKLKK